MNQMFLRSLTIALVLTLSLSACRSGRDESPKPTTVQTSLDADEDPAVEPEAEQSGDQNATSGEAATAAANSEEGTIMFKSESLHGETTASGEAFDKDAMSAAHKDLPFGTVVTVTNLQNDKSVVVTINDRIPENNPTMIDVSPAAARELDMIEAGSVEGRIEWGDSD